VPRAHENTVQNTVGRNSEALSANVCAALTHPLVEGASLFHPTLIENVMRKFVLALCYCLTLILPSAHAQNAAPIDPAATAAVKELLVSMNYRELLTQSFAQLEKNMPAIMLQGVTAAINGSTKLNAAEKKAALEKATKEIPAVAAAFGETLKDPKLMDELFTEMTPLYARHFSAAEIGQVSAFYKTPVGKKMLATMPQIMGESMQISQKIMMPRISAAIDKLSKGK
jgi:hypothetical protein